MTALDRRGAWRHLARRCGLLVGMVLAMGACSSRDQNASQVAIRPPGHRLLGAPEPVKETARMHWAFAWIADAAYGRAPNNSGCEAAAAELDKAGWKPWAGFPTPSMLESYAQTDLRVAVWQNDSARTVVVGFGGTVFSNAKHWAANLRWFLPTHHDQYTDLVEKFGPSFVSALLERRIDPEWTLIATGHSLGGGLAQQFAYAFPRNETGYRVRSVLAFDPSPVTGYFSVGKDLRDFNRTGLSIDRIYERGEILALLRSLTSLVVAPSEVDPSIRGIRYNFIEDFDPFREHSMSRLACALQRAAMSP